MEDKERSGQPKKFADAELEAILEEGTCQMQEEHAEELAVVHSTVYKRLKAMGMISKQGDRVPYELKPRDVDF